MKKAALLSILVAVMLLAVGVTAQAQQEKKVYRIGYLSGRSEAGPLDEVFKAARAEGPGQCRNCIEFSIKQACEI